MISVACAVRGMSAKRVSGSIMITSCFLFNFVFSDLDKELLLR